MLYALVAGLLLAQVQPPEPPDEGYPQPQEQINYTPTPLEILTVREILNQEREALVPPIESHAKFQATVRWVFYHDQLLDKLDDQLYSGYSLETDVHFYREMWQHGQTLPPIEDAYNFPRQQDFDGTRAGAAPSSRARPPPR